MSWVFGFIEKQIVQVEQGELETRVNHVPEQEDKEAQVVQVILPK